MKKKIIIATILALMIAAVSVLAVACGGGTTLEEGSYSGTYKCSYTADGETKYVGCKAAFDVDDANNIWDITVTALEAEGDITYTSPSLGQRPWDSGKILGQFSGAWTVDEFMKINVTIDANGVAKIESSKEITVGVGFELGTAVVILAVQNGIQSALDA